MFPITFLCGKTLLEKTKVHHLRKHFRQSFPIICDNVSISQIQKCRRFENLFLTKLKYLRRPLPVGKTFFFFFSFLMAHRKWTFFDDCFFDAFRRTFALWKILMNISNAVWPSEKVFYFLFFSVYACCFMNFVGYL